MRGRALRIQVTRMRVSYVIGSWTMGVNNRLEYLLQHIYNSIMKFQSI